MLDVKWTCWTFVVCVEAASLGNISGTLEHCFCIKWAFLTPCSIWLLRTE